MAVIPRHLTATVRAGLSAPVRRALRDGVITRDTGVLDYGCGRGRDVAWLKYKGVRDCYGYDPYYAPLRVLWPEDVVLLLYVLNVIEDPAERVKTLTTAWGLCRGVMVVAARVGSLGLKDPRPYGDGFLTRRGTFQLGFRHPVLREYLATYLGVEPVGVMPGVFYAFKDAGAAGDLPAQRRARRRAVRAPGGDARVHG